MILMAGPCLSLDSLSRWQMARRDTSPTPCASHWFGVMTLPALAKECLKLSPGRYSLARVPLENLNRPASGMEIVRAMSLPALLQRLLAWMSMSSFVGSPRRKNSPLRTCFLSGEKC